MAAQTTGRFVIVWVWVMGLALASFLLSRLHLGAAAPFVAFAIAIAKATLIAWFFMHLVEQPSISRLAFALGIGLALWLLFMVGLDVITRTTTQVRQPGARLELRAPQAPPRRTYT